MSVSLSVQQIKSLPDASTYRVVTTVTASVGMPKEVFVYKSDTDLYDHVASVFDLDTFPTTRDLSVAFYRQLTVTQNYTDVGVATIAANTVSTALSELVVTYGQAVAVFPGTSNTTYIG